MDNDDTDPEIEAMRTIVTALDTLDESAQGRIIRWASARYTTTEEGD